MGKTYILDTNILLVDPKAFLSFKKNDVVIPYIVIEELERQKHTLGETGMNARDCSRRLAKLLENQTSDNLKKGIALENGGTLIVIPSTDYKNSVDFGHKSKPGDDYILTVCVGLHKEKKNVVLVSNDTILRLRASSFGILTETYDAKQDIKSLHDLYQGYTQIEVEEEILGKFWEEYPKNIETFNASLKKYIKGEIFPNDFVVLGPPKKKPYALLRTRDRKKPHYDFVREQKLHKVTPQNIEQAMAIELLMDPKIHLVTLTGISGTGKTLLSLAAGLEQVIDKNVYDRMIIIRPIHPTGKDLGFLPGPQPLDAKILTPDGWTTMGQLKVGSKIIAKNGKSTKVTKILPKGKKQVYKITTSDGTSTECCDDHLWFTTTAENIKRNKSGCIKTTQEIRKSLLNPYYGRKFNHFLPRNEQVHFNKQKLPLPPYLLGAILGDGSIGNSISFTNIDEEIIERVRKEAKFLGCSLKQSGNTIIYNFSTDNLYNNKTAKPVCITDIKTGKKEVFPSVGIAEKKTEFNRSVLHYRCSVSTTIDNKKFEFLPKQNRWQNPIKEILHNLGLGDKKAYNKFIPDTYKYNSSIQERIDLLQGLMDTDGTIKKNGEASFTTISKQLAQDIIEITQSLGGRAKIRERNRVGKHGTIGKRKIIAKHTTYEFNISLPKNINPFYLSRKAERHNCSCIFNIAIVSVEPVGVKEVQCIVIEDPEHLYITDNYIVTHNSLQEKLDPWLTPIRDNLKYLMPTPNPGTNGKKKASSGYQNFDYLIDKGQLEIEAITYIRGRSIRKSYILIDESQNISSHELKAIVTRAGKGSKVVLTGDIEQTDRTDVDSVSNGLSVAIEKFKRYAIAGHVSLKEGIRSELSALAAQIL